MSQVTNPTSLLVAALQGFRQRVTIGNPRIVGHRRGSPTESGRVDLAVPDWLVQGVTKLKKRRGRLLIVYVPGDVLDEMESPIVRP